MREHKPTWPTWETHHYLRKKTGGSMDIYRTTFSANTVVSDYLIIGGTCQSWSHQATTFADVYSEVYSES